jgi:glycosyltransferase involved in cell wall biosynthesis
MTVTGKKSLIVHGLWIGSSLSRLELLTLKSFLRWGHEFHLWLYDPLDAPLPDGVRHRDAAQILPRERIFRKRGRDRETGVGDGSVSPFSDLFRYKLLHELGGWWTDMDVTCLRPLDFEDDYVFRYHRLGMIGNLMKCPQGSELMRICYEECEPIANGDIDWLAQVRVLNKHVLRLGLDGFIRDDISNRDNWPDSLGPLVMSPTPIPRGWYAIHWMSEFLRTLKLDQGRYLGRQFVDAWFDKDDPPLGGTLRKLYSYYGLLEPRTTRAGSVSAAWHLQGSNSPCVPQSDRVSPEGRLHIMLPSLVRGGAERTVVETVRALSACDGARAAVFVMGATPKSYALESDRRTRVEVFDGSWASEDLQRIAREILSASPPVLFAHLIPAQRLAELWSLGIETVPVVHNDHCGWLDAATSYNHPFVPFVIAVAEAVSVQLRERGCLKPIVTIRHELQRTFDDAELAAARHRIRQSYGLAEDTLLIGMVGQFKSQKAYTRAVRVLSTVRRTCAAKLVILGDWEHKWGSGRIAYAATVQLAKELGVREELILPGNVDPVDLHYGAFDVYLNTSVFEGLSISLLEAAAAGCPVVAADVGGNREAVADNAVLVADPADIETYVKGILKVARVGRCRARRVPTAPDLIPRLWMMLARHGVDQESALSAGPSGVLFVTDRSDGNRRSQLLRSLVASVAATRNTALCALDGTDGEALHRRISNARTPCLCIPGTNFIEGAEKLLGWFDQLKLRILYFWVAPPELKLLCAKVLMARDVRLVDVSLSPGYLDQLEATRQLQSRLAFGTDAYLSRLDDLIALQPDAAPLGAAQPRRVSILQGDVDAACGSLGFDRMVRQYAGPFAD